MSEETGSNLISGRLFTPAIHCSNGMLNCSWPRADRSRDFEQTDGGDGDLARISMRCERSLGFPEKSWSTRGPPHQNIGVDDDQRFMSQSSAGKTGSNGRS